VGELIHFLLSVRQELKLSQRAIAMAALTKIPGWDPAKAASECKKNPQCWSQAKARCCNPKHKKFSSYGRRGIAMCDEWLDIFWRFFRDMATTSRDAGLMR
jgi:hypothetical protein